MRLSLVILLMLLQACAGGESVSNEVAQNFAPLGFERKIYNTSPFKIFTLQKITNPNLPIHVYIEGDGRAYLNKYMPSHDPTPREQTLLGLMREDTYPNLLYLARPCQYGLQDNKCEEKYWTLARFAPEVINAENEVLGNFKNSKLELIGYSGGGQIGVLLASENANVISLRTIAGNLDHNAFTKIHDSTPLVGSVNPDAAIRKISNLPQVHFIGGDDETVTGEVAESYKRKQSSDKCSKYITVDGAGHSEGWKEKWPELLLVKPGCE